MAFWKRPPTKEDTTPSTQPSVAVAAMPVAERKPKGKPQLELLDEKEPAAATTKKSFDPYNSGVFDRRHTWEKVNRK